MIIYIYTHEDSKFAHRIVFLAFQSRLVQAHVQWVGPQLLVVGACANLGPHWTSYQGRMDPCICC